MVDINQNLKRANDGPVGQHVDSAGNLVITGDNNPLPVKLSDGADKMEYYGATQTERPDPTTVPVGAIYLAVDTQETWQSNGTSWVVI